MVVRICSNRVHIVLAPWGFLAALLAVVCSCFARTLMRWRRCFTFRICPMEHFCEDVVRAPSLRVAAGPAKRLPSTKKVQRNNTNVFRAMVREGEMEAIVYRFPVGNLCVVSHVVHITVPSLRS